jgi:hypothetical protein
MKLLQILNMVRNAGLSSGIHYLVALEKITMEEDKPEVEDPAKTIHPTGLLVILQGAQQDQLPSHCCKYQL